MLSDLGHRDEDVPRARAGDPGLHRVENASTQIVTEATQAGNLAHESGDDRDRRVAIEVIDDDKLMRRPNARRQRPEHGLDRFTFVVNRQNHGEFGIRGFAHWASIRNSQHQGIERRTTLGLATDARG